MIVLKSENQIYRIKKACQLVAKYLELVKDTARPGMTTLKLDEMAATFAKDNVAIPAFKGYREFPYSICASVNDEVIHGMPNDKPLQEGDILSVDYGILLDGYYGDSTITVPIGEISDDAKALVKTGQECLYRGIEAFCEGSRLNKISHAIQSHAESNGYGVVRSFVGHGIGRNLHEDPQLFNFTNKPAEGIILHRGLVLAIEPMIVAGSYDLVRDKNLWTHRTEDGMLSAHWEHTVALTQKGTEILTLRRDDYEFSENRVGQ
jgi:methionyl aminopeptidase